VVVVPDDSPLPTPAVFREADRLGLPRDADGLARALAEVEDGLPDLPDALCVNELEPAALSLRPALAGRLEALRAAGADVAMVSGGVIVVIGLAVYGAGLIHLPNVEKLLTDAGDALGAWTYAVVAAAAFLETGAFVGLIAPGETIMVFGGVVAGQGKVNIIALI